MRFSLKVLAIAAFVSAGLPLAYGAREAAADALPQRSAAARVVMLAPGVLLAPQISPQNLEALRAAGVKSVIDLRPDGEERGQPSSAEMAAAAAKASMTFAYVPTRHGPIPDAVVEQFSKALAAADGPTLIYCHSGSRASAVWALSEASRPGGFSAATILSAVRATGRSADWEKAEIERRIAARAKK